MDAAVACIYLGFEFYEEVLLVLWAAPEFKSDYGAVRLNRLHVLDSSAALAGDALFVLFMIMGGLIFAGAAAVVF